MSKLSRKKAATRAGNRGGKSESVTAGFHTMIPRKPNREELEQEVRILREQLGKRTPVEEAAQNVDILRTGVNETRERITQLELQLQEERSRLSATMLSHIEAVAKFKDMTALTHQVP